MTLSYALISALILCCGYLCYRWLMADERQHGYNRALLYIIYAVALLAPLFMVSGNAPLASASQGMVDIGELNMVGNGIAPDKESGVRIFPILSRVLVLIYIIGVAAMVALSAFGFVSLLKIINKGEKIPAGKYVLVITANHRLAPFSWMRYIVMTASDYAESGEVIMKHEISHLRLRHWIDLMVAQGVICVQWFNPAAWLMRDELRSVHEYQADDAVLRSGVEIEGYQRMLIKKAVGSRFQSFANSLNHSKLKKRVTMMYKEKSSAARRWSALLLAPALAAGCFVTAIPAVASVLDSFANVSFASGSESKVSEISATPEIKLPETAAATDSKKGKRKVFHTPEKCAEFPDGMAAMIKYLQENIQYPEEAEKNGEQGLVVVKFVVETDGTVTGAQIVKSVTKALDAEALRVVTAMPKWEPGKIEGKPVPTWYNLPVKFKLPADKVADKEKK